VARRERGFALLIGATALILQLLLSPLHAPFVHSAPGALRSDALAELAALTGEQNLLCGDEDGSGNPAHHDADCPGLCCQLGHGLALFLVPPSPSPEKLAGPSIKISRPHSSFLIAGAHSTSAQPRGPPLSA
jgi:hypothetical protein